MIVSSTDKALRYGLILFSILYNITITFQGIPENELAEKYQHTSNIARETEGDNQDNY